MIKSILLTISITLMLLVPVSAQQYAIDKSRAHPRGYNPNQGCGNAGGTRSCKYVCTGIGAFGRCVGSWKKVCGEWKCHRRQGAIPTEFSSQSGCPAPTHVTATSRPIRVGSQEWHRARAACRVAMRERLQRRYRIYNNPGLVIQSMKCQPGMVCKRKPIQW